MGGMKAVDGVRETQGLSLGGPFRQWYKEMWSSSRWAGGQRLKELIKRARALVASVKEDLGYSRAVEITRKDMSSEICMVWCKGGCRDMYEKRLCWIFHVGRVCFMEYGIESSLCLH
jgi:hypothetical protein